MNKFNIVSDSSCDLPAVLIKEFDIALVAYYVTLDGNHYFKEAVDMTTEAFYEKVIKEKLYPKTSLPPIQDYVDVFEASLRRGEDVVCFCLTMKFSGSCQSAYNAKRILLETYPQRRIEIIDSMQATAAQGLIVLEAARMKSKGASMDEIVRRCEILKKTARIIFTIDDFSYLSHGGRIGKASAFAGMILNIKPILVLRDGELMPEKKVRGRRKAVQEIINMTVREIGDKAQEYRVCLINIMRWEELEHIREALAEHNIEVMELPFLVGATIGTHAGPTAVGVCYVKKESVCP